jgi:CheY-like chemotaxis protein
MRPESREKYILYADDDSDDQETMRDMIAAIDPQLEVVSCENGMEALEFLRSLPENATYPCFIIMDINMPRFDGMQTLQKIKADKNLKNIPVVMFSTSSLDRDIDVSMKLGAQDYITKPVHSEEMARVTARFSDYCHELPTQIRAVNH